MVFMTTTADPLSAFLITMFLVSQSSIRPFLYSFVRLFVLLFLILLLSKKVLNACLNIFNDKNNIAV